MHGARAAAAARAMHVEEHDAIAFAERRPSMPGQRTARGIDDAGRDVPGNDRIRHAGQPAVPQVHVGAAHFGARGAQQRRAGRQIGPRNSRISIGCRGAVMTAARMRSLTRFTLSLKGC